MAYENREGFGALFKNENRTSERQPEYKGSFKGLDGVEYDVAAWVKEGKKGKFLSLKVSHKREAAKERAGAPALDDSVPFAPQVD